MDVLVRYVHGKQFEMSTRGHCVISDQPTPNGEDRGMTPPELMLSGLGSCAAYYAAEYLRARNLSLEGLEVRVTGLKGGRPMRLTEINIIVDTPAISPNDERREGFMRAVHNCLLHQTLLNPPEVKLSLKAPELSAV